MLENLRAKRCKSFSDLLGLPFYCTFWQQVKIWGPVLGGDSAGHKARGNVLIKKNVGVCEKSHHQEMSEQRCARFWRMDGSDAWCVQNGETVLTRFKTDVFENYWKGWLDFVSPLRRDFVSLIAFSLSSSCFFCFCFLFVTPKRREFSFFMGRCGIEWLEWRG